VHLRHERAGRIDRSQRSRRCAGAYDRGYSVGREDDEAALRDLLDAVDEDGSARTELVDDVRVVDDLLSDVDGRPVLPERALDGLHRSLDACAISTRRREQDPLDHDVNVAAPLASISRLNKNITARAGKRPADPGGAAAKPG